MSLYQEMYDQAGFNVKVLVAGISAPETSGWFKKEINNKADLQGMNMRIFGLGGATLQELGVATNQLSGGEIFPALEKGTIDAAEFSTPAADQTKGFHKVADYNYFPGWHQQATINELLINKDVWNSLSPAQQAQMEITCQASVTNALAYSESLQADAMKQNIANGTQVRYWSDDMLAEFKKSWAKVAAEKSASDPFFKKVWDDLQAFRADYSTWSDVGFLPRVPKQ